MQSRLNAVALIVCALSFSITVANAKPLRHTQKEMTQCEFDNNGHCRSADSPQESSASRHRESHSLGLGSLEGCPRSLGCGCNSAVKFLGLSAAEAKKRGLYAARSWSHEGAPASKGCVGCFAILTRKGGGHVGKVVGYDADGNPNIQSYANRKYGWTNTVYPAGRVIAYRSI